MTNFIFKSQGTFKKISNSLEIILTELRYQRTDNVKMIYMLDKLLHDKALQKQVDEYFNDESQPDTPPNEDKEPD